MPLTFDPKNKDIIPGPIHALSVSLDTHDFFDKENPELHPVFLYTPDLNNTSTHYHIELTSSQAIDLWLWLSSYLATKPKPEEARPVPDYADIIPLQEFQDCISKGYITSYDGSGEFVKDGMMISGDVFSDQIPEGATHVAWFNK